MNKEINVLELIAKSLETKTRTFTGQIMYAMEDAMRNEDRLIYEQHRVNENEVKIPHTVGDRMNQKRLVLGKAEDEYNYYLHGQAKATRGIFDPALEGSIGFKAYLLENVLMGRDTFGLKFAKEEGYTINKESVEQLISILQTMIQE